MRSREQILGVLQDSNDTEMSLEAIGEILLDIRDLLNDLAKTVDIIDDRERNNLQ